VYGQDLNLRPSGYEAKNPLSLGFTKIGNRSQVHDRTRDSSPSQHHGSSRDIARFEIAMATSGQRAERGQKSRRFCPKGGPENARRSAAGRSFLLRVAISGDGKVHGARRERRIDSGRGLRLPSRAAVHGEGRRGRVSRQNNAIWGADCAEDGLEAGLRQAVTMVSNRVGPRARGVRTKGSLLSPTRSTSAAFAAA
jgi:hypothetical protein